MVAWVQQIAYSMSINRRLKARAVLGAGVALLLVLWLHLFAALFGALAGYVLFALGHRNRGLAALLVAGGGIAIAGGVDLLLNASTDGLPKLMQLLADTLDHIRNIAPGWMTASLPDSADALQHAISGWLRVHSLDMQHWGRMALGVLVHLLLGLVIGVMAHVSIHRRPATRPLPALAIARWQQLAAAFRDVLAAQLRIALVNAGLTAVYLLAILPAFGAGVPFAKTLVALTFFLSLVPIVGNLMSNTAIVIAALTVSPWTGIASLVFLIVIHKLEYFLNAHFVGSRVDMPVYALLASMLVLEAAFGVVGVVAAPVYCAWLTREMRLNGWIGPRTASPRGCLRRTPER